MSKLRSDSKWNGLSAEQRETLEGWLFEEHLGYREALERAQKEFGITASVRSLAEYYQHLARERMTAQVGELKDVCKEMEVLDVDWERLGGTAIALVAKRAIHLAVDSPDKVQELVSLTRLLVADETLEIKKRWLEMEEERWDREVGKENAMELRSELARREVAQMFSQKPMAGKTGDGAQGPERPTGKGVR
jgi:hypothetical protein